MKSFTKFLLMLVTIISISNVLGFEVKASSQDQAAYLEEFIADFEFYRFNYGYSKNQYLEMRGLKEWPTVRTNQKKKQHVYSIIQLLSNAQNCSEEEFAIKELTHWWDGASDLDKENFRNSKVMHELIRKGNCRKARLADNNPTPDKQHYYKVEATQ